MSNNNNSNNNNNNNKVSVPQNEVYTHLNLIISDLYVILQPDSNYSQHFTQPLKSIFIDRATHHIECRTSNSSPILSGSLKSCQKIFGCLGIISLLSGPYLICIGEFEKIGFLRENQFINKVTKSIIVPISTSPKPLSEEEKKEEKNYLALLNDLLDTFDFYYSYSFDITQSEQRVSGWEMRGEEYKMTPMWKRADSRFFWNRYIMKPLIEHGGLDEFILPVMDGFIKIKDFEINMIPFKYALISRRSCKRTGARYHSRGADPLGNVANFVETEQVIVFDKVLTSFVQVRGSIPIIWQQKGKGLKPRPVVENSTQTDSAYKIHMDELIQLYGPSAIVNLIDQTGGEAAIGDRFEMESSLYENASHVNYTAFDFHEKCKNNRYENLSELLDKVKPLLEQFGYLFKSVLPGEPSLIQKGAFRTNCVDCLDRTNVVQSMFARYILHTQLTKMGILSTEQKIENNQQFESEFKNIWADNADVMSEQYTGTVALKTDYTRTGKRSVKGTMTDGMNSVRRYLNKNFKDNERQAAVDLFLGKFQVEKFPSLNAPTGAAQGATGANMIASSTDDSPLEFNIEQVEDPTLRGEIGVLRITDNSIISWVKYNGLKRIYRFGSLDESENDIIFIEKSKLYQKLLNLYHKSNPLPEQFIFSSSFTREQFLQSLYKKPQCFRFLPIAESEGKEYLTHLEKQKEQKYNSMTKDAFNEEDVSKEQEEEVKKEEEEEEVEKKEEEDDVFSPPGQPLPMRHKMLDIFNSFIGSWNMENTTLNSTFVANWIPKGKDLYSVSAQRIASYKPSPGFVMNYNQYWFYLVRQYLGQDYVCVATGTTDNTASIVLVHKSLVTAVNNISVSYIQKRSAFKKMTTVQQSNLISQQNMIVQEVNTSTSTTQSIQINSKEITTSSGGISTGNSSSSGVVSPPQNTSNAVSGGISQFFSTKKLKDYGNKLMGVSSNTTTSTSTTSATATDSIFGNLNRDANTLYGTTITLQLRDTSVCFINYCNNTPTTTFSNTPNSLDDESGMISFIKNKQYINGSTRYTFWAGDYDLSTLQRHGWVAATDTTKLHDDEPGRGIIYWKSLPESEPLLESINPPVQIQEPNNTNSLNVNQANGNSKSPSLESNNIYIYPPLSFTYSLPVLSPFSWLSIQDIPCFIIIKALYCEPFELIPSGTKLEAFIEFNAYHLISDDSSSSVRTSTIRSNIPVWNDKLELKSFIDDKEYLKTQYIQVAIFNRELMDQSVIGKGAIPLRHACGDSPYHFKVALTLQDEFSCYLHGEIQILTKSEIHNYLIQHQSEMSAGFPPIPSRVGRQHRSAPSPPISISPTPRSPNLSSNLSSPQLTKIQIDSSEDHRISSSASNSLEQLLPNTNVTITNNNSGSGTNTPTKSSFLDNLKHNLKGSGELIYNTISNLNIHENYINNENLDKESDKEQPPQTTEPDSNNNL